MLGADKARPGLLILSRRSTCVCVFLGVISQFEMESEHHPDRIKSRTSLGTNRSFSVRNSIRRVAQGQDSPDDPKGPIGLTTLYEPTGEAALDLIFIHGLNGGSRSTWTKGEGPTYFWPQEWLPKDEAFQDVRIHTFGYDSGFGRDSTLNVYDFSRSLLYSIKDAPNVSNHPDVIPNSIRFSVPCLKYCRSR